jgi:hypothetical protein
VFLAALLHHLPRVRLRQVPLIVSPDTIMRWHRDLIRRRHAKLSRLWVPITPSVQVRGHLNASPVNRFGDLVVRSHLLQGCFSVWVVDVAGVPPSLRSRGHGTGGCSGTPVQPRADSRLDHHRGAAR